MIIVIPCVEIHFEPRFFAGIQMGNIWAPYECHPPKSGVVVAMLFCSLCLPVVEKTRVNLWRSLIFVARFPTLNAPLKKTVGVRSFQICHGDQNSLKDVQSNMIY